MLRELATEPDPARRREIAALHHARVGTDLRPQAEIDGCDVARRARIAARSARAVREDDVTPLAARDRMLALADALEARTAAILATARDEPAAASLRAVADRLEADLAAHTDVTWGPVSQWPS